ncbi:MAG: hypothetical protein ACR2MW_04105 [Chthoniobacterales bacterium]
MKRWLSRRKRALLECAPINDAPPNDRAMRSALESARTIPEVAASLTTQQQFDQPLARLVGQIEIPKAAEEWFVNVALIKGAKRSWKRTARHPAILATALAILVMAGVSIYFLVERLQEFPGSVMAKNMLVVASHLRRTELEPLNTDAINIGDYFFMKYQMEHFDVPMAFADLRATGARVFDDPEGHRVAQVALAESGVQFFLYPAETPAADERGKKGASPRWRYVENEGWTGAVEVRNGVCFMIAMRGTKEDLAPYLANRQK